MEFLTNSKEIVFTINNWEIYRRAAESTKVDLTEIESPIYDYKLDIQITKRLSELLLAENVSEFNHMKSQNKNRTIRLAGVTIRHKNLSGIDFSNVNLTSSRKYNTNLSQANLGRVNLINSDFTGADLTEAKLVGANLSETKLDNTILMNTDFEFAMYLPIRISEAKTKGSSIHARTAIQ